MKPLGLTADELDLIRQVLLSHPGIQVVKIFGSRAKGTAKPYSDIDLAVWGEVDPFQAEEISAQLDELPLPYKFEVKPFASITLPALREHIERVGIEIFSRPQVPNTN